MLKFTRSCSMIFLGAVAFLPVHPAPRTAVPERGNATMTVTALEKKMAALPAVSQEDVRFFVNKERTQSPTGAPGRNCISLSSSMIPWTPMSPVSGET